MDQDSLQPTARFSNRVVDYLKYRPNYPALAIDFIVSEVGLNSSSVIADLGTGTGISARPFLERGIQVYGIEPNPEMRDAGIDFLKGFHNFHSVRGTAEVTGLPSRSVDHAIAAQAFHWFRPAETRIELQRILRPGGSFILLWNERLTSATPFLREYEALIRRFSVDYEKVDHRNVDEARLSSFYPSGFSEMMFPNVQRFDFDGVLGRLRSSSYVPAPDTLAFGAMAKELRGIFANFQIDGLVDILYECKVFSGQMSP